MNTIFGIPADTLMYILLGLLALIFLGVGLTAWRYPLPFRLGVRNLPRRKSQTLLIIVGLALSTLIIASALKYDGVWWNAVDPDRVKRFIAGLGR